MSGPGVRGWIGRLVGSPRRLEEDLDDELRFHIEGRIEELVAAGWSRAEARTEALRRFGNPGRVREECRALDQDRVRRERRLALLEALGRDVRFSVRSLVRNPVFAAVAILTLALGIGATTAVFSVVDGVLLRPLPFEDPHELVAVWERNEAQALDRDPPSPPNFADWRERSRSFEDLAATQIRSARLFRGEVPEMVQYAAVSAGLFDLLGAEPALGRFFRPEEGEGAAAPATVLSHGFWQSRFGGDPDVIGRTLTLDRTPVEVVGVAPAGFDVASSDVALWVPTWWANPAFHRQTRSLFVIGRLAEGVTPEAARSDLDRIQRRIAEVDPEANRGWSTAVVPLHDEMVGEAGELLWLLLGAVGLLLLIACVNVANLLLARAASRKRELGVRAALGGGHTRIRLQLLTEAAVLALAGGLLGAGLGWLGVEAIRAVAPAGVPRIGEVAVDVRVLGFAFAITALTGLIFGLVPARAAGRAANPAELLSAGAGRGSTGGAGRGGGRTGPRRLLVAGEVALSLVLLVASALLFRSLVELRSVDPGFDPEGVLAARVSLPTADYPDNAARAEYFRLLAERMRAVPGVEAAGVTSALPFTHGVDFDLPFLPQGRPEAPEEELPQTDYRIVSPGYFEAVGQRVLGGRTFTPADRADGPRVLLVNESFAREAWPGEDPVGKTVRIYYVVDPWVEWEVVGVVEDTRHQGMASAPGRQMFVPVAQAELLFGFMTLVARSSGDAASLAPALRAAALEVDPRQPLYDLVTMESLVRDSIARDRFAAFLVSVFGALALLLAAVGVYGVIAYQVSLRTREIGVRMALGADRARLLRGVVGEAATTAGAGVAVGLALSLLLTRSIASLLYGIEPADPLTLGGSSAVLVIVATLAAVPPALRAASVDPVRALREE